MQINVQTNTILFLHTKSLVCCYRIWSMTQSSRMTEALTTDAEELVRRWRSSYCEPVACSVSSSCCSSSVMMVTSDWTALPTSPATCNKFVMSLVLLPPATLQQPVFACYILSAEKNRGHFGCCWPISTILSPLQSEMIDAHIRNKIYHLNLSALLHYRVKYKQVQKCENSHVIVYLLSVLIPIGYC